MENLIRKFKEGTVNAEEFAALLRAFRNKEVSVELEETFKTLWESSSFSTDDVDAEEGWNKLSWKTGLQDTNTVEIKEKGKKRILYSLLRYAAVFVIAFGISWTLHEFFVKKPLILTPGFARVEVSNGSKSKIELPDGTIVNLNSGSFIRYPETFAEDKREVYFEGEAFFNVKKDKKRPFYVNTSDVKIKVLGTKFNVKAYPEEGEIETTLIQGKVEVFEKKGNRDIKRYLLEPSNQLVIQKSVKKNDPLPENKPKVINKISIKRPGNIEFIDQPDLYTSWKDDILKFDNERFADLISRLERWYDVKIEIRSAEIGNARLSGEFEKETIEQALAALNLAVAFRYEMDKNKITIYPMN